MRLIGIREISKHRGNVPKINEDYKKFVKILIMNASILICMMKKN